MMMNKVWDYTKKVCQRLCDGTVVFSISSTNKTDCHIIEILLKVALNTITPNHKNINVIINDFPLFSILNYIILCFGRYTWMNLTKINKCNKINSNNHQYSIITIISFFQTKNLSRSILTTINNLYLLFLISVRKNR